MVPERSVYLFTLNFCEYNRFNQDCSTIYRPSGSDDYLFLLLKTPMKVYMNGELQVTGENACLLYTPGFPQHYQAVRRFCNSYLHFSSDEDPSILYGIPANQIFYPADYPDADGLIRRLQQEYFSLSSFRDEYINTLIIQLFITLSRSLSRSAAETEETETLYPAFQSMRLAMLTNCQEDWDVKRLCRLVNLERSQFYVYYHHFFSTTPKADLLQARLEKAKNLLSNEALQVKEVALLCGFRNLEHFTRYFTGNCGCSPRKWQEQANRTDRRTAETVNDASAEGGKQQQKGNP